MGYVLFENIEENENINLVRIRNCTLETIYANGKVELKLTHGVACHPRF